MTTAELAARPDFRLGATCVSPSTRTVHGPGGRSGIEPRVMQVLVVLADAANHVVMRETLFSRCWGGIDVGDDSFNRAIGAVRRIAKEVGDGCFQIETIPRTGYRLAIEGGAGTTAMDESVEQSRPPMLTRRTAVAGTLAAAAIAGGIGLWSNRSEDRRQFSRSMERGIEALDFGDPSANPVQYFQRAVGILPDDTEAQAMLAYALVLGAEYAQRGQDSGVEEAERATNAALVKDPCNPFATRKCPARAVRAGHCRN